MYMDDLKVFVKNEKRTGNPNTDSDNKKLGYRDEIWHWKIRKAKRKDR